MAVGVEVAEDDRGALEVTGIGSADGEVLDHDPLVHPEASVVMFPDRVVEPRLGVVGAHCRRGVRDALHCFQLANTAGAASQLAITLELGARAGRIAADDESHAASPGSRSERLVVTPERDVRPPVSGPVAYESRDA